MRVKDHKKFTTIDYPIVEDNTYGLGDIVINQYGEIGVIIQIHCSNEFRTDEFGNVSANEIKLATIDEIKFSTRPYLLN